MVRGQTLSFAAFAVNLNSATNVPSDFEQVTPDSWMPLFPYPWGLSLWEENQLSLKARARAHYWAPALQMSDTPRFSAGGGEGVRALGKSHQIRQVDSALPPKAVTDQRP